MRRRFAPVDIFRFLPYVWQKKMIESAKLKNDVPDKHEIMLLYCVLLQNQMKMGIWNIKNSIFLRDNKRYIRLNLNNSTFLKNLIFAYFLLKPVFKIKMLYFKVHAHCNICFKNGIFRTYNKWSRTKRENMLIRNWQQLVVHACWTNQMEFWFRSDILMWNDDCRIAWGRCEQVFLENIKI